MALVSITLSCNNGTEWDSQWHLKQTKKQGCGLIHGSLSLSETQETEGRAFLLW